MKSANASLAITLAVVVVSCGGGVDQEKFDRVFRAAKALQTEIHSTGGTSDRSKVLQKELETEVSVLEGRVKGKKETDAIHAFREANDAYKYFLRFRFLDYDAVDGRILIAGTNLEVASRYGLTLETRGNSQWTDSGEALKITSTTAEEQLAEATRLMNGQ